MKVKNLKRKIDFIERRISQKELSKSINVNDRTIRKYKKSGSISPENYKKILNIFNNLYNTRTRKYIKKKYKSRTYEDINIYFLKKIKISDRFIGSKIYEYSQTKHFIWEIEDFEDYKLLIGDSKFDSCDVFQFRSLVKFFDGTNDIFSSYFRKLDELEEEKIDFKNKLVEDYTTQEILQNYVVGMKLL